MKPIENNPNDFNHKIAAGKKLRKYRRASGLTQKALADKSGVSLMSIRRYESGERFPPINILIKLCDALGVDWYLSFAGIFDELEIKLDYESQLLRAYRKLNEEGKIEAIKRIEELTLIDKYMTPDEDIF